MERELREFLGRYIGQGEQQKDKVREEDVEMLMAFAVSRHVEQVIIDFGTDNPDAPFWDFLKLIPPDPEDYEPDEDE